MKYNLLIIILIIEILFIILQKYPKDINITNYKYISKRVEGIVSKINQKKRFFNIRAKKIQLLNDDIKRVFGDVIVFFKDLKISNLNKFDTVQVYGDLTDYAREGGRKYNSYKLFIFKPLKVFVLEKEKGIKCVFEKIKLYCMDFLNCFDIRERVFLKALLFGDKTGLDNTLKNKFIKAGAIHTLAVSGLHVGFLSIIIVKLLFFIRICNKYAELMLLFILPIYCIACSFSPSVSRAVLMICLFIILKYSHGYVRPFYFLVFSSFIILAISPINIYNPGFLLSSSAMLGIIVFYKDFKKIFNNLKIPGFLSSALSVSISAQLAVFPILVNYFGEVSLVSVISNLIIIPIVSLILTAGFFIGIVLNLFGLEFLKILIVLLIDLLLFIVELFAKLPFASIKIESFSVYTVVLYYLLLTLILKGRQILEIKYRYTGYPVTSEITEFFKTEQTDC